MKKKITLISLVALMSLFTACGSSYKGYDSAQITTESFYDRNNAVSDSFNPFSPAESEGYDFDSDYNKEYYEESVNPTTGGYQDVSNQTVIEVNEVSSNRKVIKTAYLSIETLEFEKFISELEGSLAQFGAYIENSDVTGNNIYYTSSRRASYTIRVPQDKITDFLGQVGTLGNVTSTHYGEQDITLSYVDVESRIKTLKTEQETLLNLLAKAEYISDVIDLERRLSEVNYEIENYTSRLRTFDSQITYSTVSINLIEVERITPIVKEPVVEKTLGERIKISFVENLKDIWRGIQNFIIWFVTHIIGIVIWAIIIFVVVRIIIKSSKKKAAKKAAANKLEGNTKNKENETDLGNQK
ncbi:MAG: DUF4349 domain-containing protein [Lachnospiraceae bacterium]|nr:DUF4349 domain-containing protein [Lachnospiraceae bacterium]